MAHGRSLGPDGVTLEFFIKFWDLIGDDFTSMIHLSIAEGRLPLGMTSGIITLIFKEGDRANLSNWRPITLLMSPIKFWQKPFNSDFKVFFKK